MYLHLGQETVVTTNEIIGIFDMDNTTISKWTRKFLNNSEKQGRVISLTTDLPKTFVVLCPPAHRRRASQLHTVYLSQLSTATLRKRTGYNLK